MLILSCQFIYHANSVLSICNLFDEVLGASVPPEGGVAAVRRVDDFSEGRNQLRQEGVFLG